MILHPFLFSAFIEDVCGGLAWPWGSCWDSAGTVLRLLRATVAQHSCAEHGKGNEEVLDLGDFERSLVRCASPKVSHCCAEGLVLLMGWIQLWSSPIWGYICCCLGLCVTRGRGTTWKNTWWLSQIAWSSCGNGMDPPGRWDGGTPEHPMGFGTGQP